MVIRTFLRRAAVILSIVAAAAGGLIFDSHRFVGPVLVIIGVAGAMYMYLSSEASQGKNERLFETTAQMLSIAGLGNPFTKQITIRLAKGGTYNDILSDLDRALAVDPHDLDALTLYVSVSSLQLSLERHISHGKWMPDPKLMSLLMARADEAISGGRHLSELYVGKGILLDLLGNHSQAQRLFRASGRCRSDPYWRLALSTSFGMERDFESSVCQIEIAIREGAKGPPVDFHYARTLSAMGHYGRAIELLERVRSERGNYFFLLDELKTVHWLLWHPFRSAYFQALSGLFLARRKPTLAQIPSAWNE